MGLVSPTAKDTQRRRKGDAKETQRRAGRRAHALTCLPAPAVPHGLNPGGLRQAQALFCQMIYLFTEKQKRLILADTTIAEDALFNQSEASASQEGPPAIWCPVATVAEEQHYGPGGQEIHLGTKHFRAGTKVYCLPPQWGDAFEDIMVFGRHRSNRHYVEMAIPSWRLTNWRTELVYSPTIMRKLEHYWDGTMASKLAAQELAELGHLKETQHRPASAE